MKNIFLTALFLLPVSIPGIIYADLPAGAVYLDGGESKIAVILAHGRGKNPRWKVVDPLRIAVNTSLGYHTLSLQMPNANKYWLRYADDFLEAYKIIDTAIRYLKDEKGVTTIYLMGHSMGSRMMSAYVAHHPDQPLSGLIIAGCRNGGGPPLSCNQNILHVNIPVLDIWGDDSDKDSNAANERRTFVSIRYQQVPIPGANHRFDGYEKEFVTAVISWLKTRNNDHGVASVSMDEVSVHPAR